MNIVLIGMRGSGKTTVAKLLSHLLNREIIEMDEEIVKRERETIPKIVEKYGWEYFRDKETKLVEEIENMDNKIISSGGGVVIRPENVKRLRKNGKLIFLSVSIDTLLKRIGDDPNRPSLTGKKSRREDMEEVLEQRETLYKEAADEVLDTEYYSPSELAKIIISKI